MNVLPARWLRPSAHLCGRLGLGLLVLAALCLTLGVSVRPAHALTRLTVTDCSSDAQLQAEVVQANNDNAGDVITFACSGDIKLTHSLTITGSMTLSGSGQHVTLDGGGPQFEMFLVNLYHSPLDSFTLNALTVAHGLTGLDNGIGNVTISNSTISGNGDGFGGGLFNDGTMTISNSTIADNGGTGLINGMSSSESTMSIANSTIVGNGGGGLFNSGTMTITNITVADNTGDVGLENGATMSMSGSIFANNTVGDCLSGLNDFGSFTDKGYNLSSDSSCGFTGTGDLQNANPQLGPLASNGGPTQTLALLKGSPASDVIPLSSGLCPATDQRGHKRPDNRLESACDIGAFES
jgi:hypothetical protein